MGLQLRGSVLGGLPASSVLPIPHPRPMGQLWGCRQAAAVGWGAGVGLQPPPRCTQTQCWGALRGLPSFLLSALSLIHAPWGSCGAVSRQQVWGCSSGARCWGELRQWEGSPPSPQYCIPCPRPMGQVWGCRQQLGVGGQVWGCSPPCCTQTQCWGALRGLPCFSSVLCTSSMSHGAAVGLQACSSCRFWGRCGAAAPLVHSGAQCGGEGTTVGASFLLLSAPYFTHHPVGQLWGCKWAGVGQQLRDSVLGGLSFSALRTSSTVLRGSCGAAGKCGAAAPWWARAQSWGN